MNLQREERQHADRPPALRLLLLQPAGVPFAAAHVPSPSSLAAAAAAAAIPIAAPYNQSSQDLSPTFNLAAANFNPSVVIVMVILLSAFFFMGFFSLYLRRCGDRSSDRSAALQAAADSNPDASGEGLDPRILHSLPLIAYSSAKKKGNNIECVVCLTEFEEQEPLRQLPGCKHVFHPDCIDMWLFSHSTCPLCRRKIGTASSSAVSFRWGSGSFRNLPFLTRGISGVPQNAAPASSEEAGTMPLIESRTRVHIQSSRSAGVAHIQSSRSTGTGVCRSASAEMSNIIPSGRRTWESGPNAAIQPAAAAIGEAQGQDTAGASNKIEHRLRLARANSTGHCLTKSGAN